MSTRITCRADFDSFFHRFFSESGIKPEYHSYFYQSSDRLWMTAEVFQLFSRKSTNLLEIGPGFAFLPFLWKSAIAENVATLDGESFELDELDAVYRRYGIEPHTADLFRVFGERDPARNRLPFDSDRFDSVICWESIEHFNFNPIPFLHEMARVMRPGGSAFITVPNQAKLDFRLRLLSGKSVRTPIHDYVLQMDDRNRMKYAPHWREYTLPEFVELLGRAGFQVEQAGHLHTFANLEAPGFGRRLKRAMAGIAARLVPSFGTLCVVTARKR